MNGRAIKLEANQHKPTKGAKFQIEIPHPAGEPVSARARGMRNHEVAEETGLSVNTVRAHLREVFSKLGVSHRGQLADTMKPARQEESPGYEI